jgi:hypothetical protein
MQDPLNWLSIIAGFLAGVLWLYASNIKVPTKLASGYGGNVVGLEEMSAGFKRQAAWNSYAAIATAAAAVLQAAARL